ncbi:MAG: omptin family outer membrane protease [Treponema sp.]
MYKILFFCLILLCSHLNSEKKADFYFGLSMHIGENQEKVFNNGRLLSLLQWPMLPSISLNFALSISFPYLHIALENNFGIPSFSGTMKDSDYTDPNSLNKTLFSAHKAIMKENIVISSLVGIPVGIPIKKYNIVLEPQIGFYFSSKSWYAKDGYTQYKSNDGSKFWSENWPKKIYKGDGAKYTQKVFFPFISFNTKIEIQNKLNINLKVLFSPLLQGITEDIHFDTKKIYSDSFSIPNYAFEINGLLEKEISKKIFIYGSISFFYFYSKNGSTIVLDKETKNMLASYPKGSSGIDGKELKLTIGTLFKLY